MTFLCCLPSISCPSKYLHESFLPNFVDSLSESLKEWPVYKDSFPQFCYKPKGLVLTGSDRAVIVPTKWRTVFIFSYFDLGWIPVFTLCCAEVHKCSFRYYWNSQSIRPVMVHNRRYERSLRHINGWACTLSSWISSDLFWPSTVDRSLTHCWELMVRIRTGVWGNLGISVSNFFILSYSKCTLENRFSTTLLIIYNISFLMKIRSITH